MAASLDDEHDEHDGDTDPSEPAADQRSCDRGEQPRREQGHAHDMQQ